MRPTIDPWEVRLLAKDSQETFPTPSKIGGRPYESAQAVSMKRRSRLDIKGARFPAQKKSGLPSSHSRVSWFPSLVCRLEGLLATGPQYKLCVNKHASQDGLCDINCSPQDGLCDTNCSPQDGLCDTNCSPQDGLCDINCSSQETAALPSSLQETAASPSSPQGEAATPRNSSQVRAPLRGARDQYSTLALQLKKPRPASPSIVHLGRLCYGRRDWQ
ncbi:hypothetical protein N7466_001539 [Penicillium verhagenii]|uniref:uncharacterized protein n=1 Tax=Penicillium verhagenii TaxID=1562060 RepID=UPI002544D46D|nr:uncharacterized protein N7466_001539 [Penicillium verhagenii]KAJ5938405.1 hypothetical protein N7466_001539 [Penicillium verhagenii]